MAEALKPLKPLEPLKPLTPLGGSGRLDSSDSLYQLARQKGLQKEADEIVALHSGEEHKKIFSGGFISDAFDVLNVGSYGVVGMLKGQGFQKGIENRESFSDDDALGKYGLTGKIAGLVADIATDPFTYIAPWTILNKVPGLAKAGKAAKEATLGKMVEREIGDTGQKFQALEGGIPLPFAEKTGIETLGQLAQKFVWGFGQDPIYREAIEQHQRNIGISMQKSKELLDNFSGMEPTLMKNTLERDATGRFRRKTRQELQREMSSADFAKVAPIWDRIDNMGRELVDLGVLGKGKFEENVGRYIRNAYEEFEVAKAGAKKAPAGSRKMTTIQANRRKEGLTAEGMEKLGQIDNPDYLLGKTMFDMARNIENAKLAKILRNFASEEELVGFSKVAESRANKVSAGAQSEVATQVTKIRDTVKPVIQTIKKAAKEDRGIARSTTKLEREMDKLIDKQNDALTRLFNATPDEAGRLPAFPKIIDDALRGLDSAILTAKTPADLASVRKEAAKIVRQNIPKENQGRFLGRIADAKTPEKLKALRAAIKRDYDTISDRVSRNAQKDITDDVQKLTKQINKLAMKADMSDGARSSLQKKMEELTELADNLKSRKADLKLQMDELQFGDLAGKYLPNNIVEHLNDLVDTKQPFGASLVGEFKYNKVVFNLATHVRNMLSNKVLNWWKLGIGPWRLDMDAQAFKSIATKDEWYRRAEEVGMGANTYASQELKGLLDDPAVMSKMGKYGAKYKKLRDKIGEMYQQEENWAKLVAFRNAVEKQGLSDSEAWKVAESATFNYAQVTPLIRKMRTALWGVPFITFPLKAAPVAVETALKNPARISFFGKAKTAIENMSDQKETEHEKKSLPAYIRDGFYIKLPIKDSEGRPAYFDLTYIIPFGDLLSGQLFERPISKETGMKEGVPASIASKNPMFNLMKELMNNQDFSGNSIWRDSDSMDKQMMDITNHISKTFLPPWVSDQMPGGYNRNGERSTQGLYRAATEGGEGQKRTLMQDVFKYAGFKVQPLDADVQDSINEFNKKKALQTLLQERGLVKSFSNVYQPK